MQNDLYKNYWTVQAEKHSNFHSAWSCLYPGIMTYTEFKFRIHRPGIRFKPGYKEAGIAY